MTSKIKRQIFAHSFLNPPSEELDCNIDIVLENSIGKFNLEKAEEGFQTQYLLTVNEPSIIDLNSHHRRAENAIKDLVLALNLNLEHSCFSIRHGGMPITKTIPEPSRVKIEKTSKGPSISITAPPTITSSYHLTIGSKENLNEEEVIDTLNKIILVNRFDLKPTLRYTNLSKALNEYENAMHPSDRLTIFRSLYTSIEVCVNWTGTDYTSDCLDSEIASIAKIEDITARYWRKLYNRTKHADMKTQHIETLKQGIESLSSVLPQIKKVAKQLIINRLNQIPLIENIL